MFHSQPAWDVAWRGKQPWYPWYLPEGPAEPDPPREGGNIFFMASNGTTGGIATQKFEIKIYRWNEFQKYQVICMNYLFVHLDWIIFGLDLIIGSKAIHKSRLPMVGFENKLASLKSPCLS